MVDVADENDAICHLGLRMTFEAQVGVALDQHLGIDGSVGIVADRATFTQRGVFENERPGLFAVTLGAIFIESRHGKAAGGFHNVHAMGIVALDAVHLAFDHGMMLRQVEFGAGFLVALETSFGLLAGINDEFFQAAAPGHGNVFASRAVAGFTAVLAGHF